MAKIKANQEATAGGDSSAPADDLLQGGGGGASGSSSEAESQALDAVQASGDDASDDTESVEQGEIEQDATAAATASAAVPSAPSGGESIRALVLRDCPFGQAGDIESVSVADAEIGVTHGMLDTNPSAVTAAER